MFRCRSFLKHSQRIDKIDVNNLFNWPLDTSLPKSAVFTLANPPSVFHRPLFITDKKINTSQIYDCVLPSGISLELAQKIIESSSNDYFIVNGQFQNLINIKNSLNNYVKSLPVDVKEIARLFELDFSVLNHNDPLKTFLIEKYHSIMVSSTLNRLLVAVDASYSPLFLDKTPSIISDQLSSIIETDVGLHQTFLSKKKYGKISCKIPSLFSGKNTGIFYSNLSYRELSRVSLSYLLPLPVFLGMVASGSGTESLTFPYSSSTESHSSTADYVVHELASTYNVFVPTRVDYVSLTHSTLNQYFYRLISKKREQKKNSIRVLDMGTGTGVLGICVINAFHNSLSKIKNSSHHSSHHSTPNSSELDTLLKITCLDINPRAISVCKRNLYASLDIYDDVNIDLKIKQSDLFNDLNSNNTSKDKYDLIIFNPPWLPIKPPHSIAAQLSTNSLDTAIFDHNFSLLKRFLQESTEHVDLEGEVWVVISSLPEQLQLCPSLTQLIERHSEYFVSDIKTSKSHNFDNNTSNNGLLDQIRKSESILIYILKLKSQSSLISH